MLEKYDIGWYTSCLNNANTSKESQFSLTLLTKKNLGLGIFRTLVDRIEKKGKMP